MLLILRLKRHKIDCNVFLLCVRGLYRLAYQNAFMGRLCVLQIGRLCVLGVGYVLDCCQSSGCHSPGLHRRLWTKCEFVNKLWNRNKTNSKIHQKVFREFLGKNRIPREVSKNLHYTQPKTKTSQKPTQKSKNKNFRFSHQKMQGVGGMKKFNLTPTQKPPTLIGWWFLFFWACISQDLS